MPSHHRSILALIFAMQFMLLSTAQGMNNTAKNNSLHTGNCRDTSLETAPQKSPYLYFSKKAFTAYFEKEIGKIKKIIMQKLVLAIIKGRKRPMTRIVQSSLYANAQFASKAQNRTSVRNPESIKNYPAQQQLPLKKDNEVRNIMNSVNESTY